MVRKITSEKRIIWVVCADCGKLMACDPDDILMHDSNYTDYDLTTIKGSCPYCGMDCSEVTGIGPGGVNSDYSGSWFYARPVDDIETSFVLPKE